jgi:GNAT superfamily N-acetyltransferase
MTKVSPVLAEEAVTIRQIHPADSVMEGEFVRGLSVETKHYRFLGGVNELSPAELKRLCNVDGVHSMAFVATVRRDGHEIEIGVSRYAELPSGGVGEMAVTIADAWQDKGLGELLLKRLMTYAKGHGVKQLYSVELADNSMTSVWISTPSKLCCHEARTTSAGYLSRRLPSLTLLPT